MREAVRDGIVRTLAVVGLAGAALIHLLDLPDTITGTPYIGWMYIGLIISALALGGVLVYSSGARAWKATAALALSVILGYTQANRGGPLLVGGSPLRSRRWDFVVQPRPVGVHLGE